VAPDLVQLEPTAARHWAAKASCTALALTIGLMLIDYLCGPLPRIQAFTTNEDTANTLDDYLRDPSAETILVGSSLMYRLTQDYFSEKGVRNIAIAGDSPETGLRIVANQRVLPRTVLVETNVLERAPNNELVEHYKPSPFNFAKLAPHIRPVRTLVSLVYGFSPSALRRMYASRRGEILLEAVPPPFAVPAGALRDWSNTSRTNQIRRTSEALSSAAESLRARGVQVYFVWLPMPDAIENSPLARHQQEIFHRTVDPSLPFLPLQVDRGQLRWPDGQHLNERSAILVVDAIDKAL